MALHESTSFSLKNVKYEKLPSVFVSILRVNSLSFMLIVYFVKIVEDVGTIKSEI